MSVSSKDREAPGGLPAGPQGTRAGAHAADASWPRNAPGDPGSPALADAPSSAQLAAPSIVVCDDGELEDVVEMLHQLDQRPLRVRPSQVEQLLEWERPKRLFVTTVRVALSHPLGPTGSTSDAVCIAVADSDAHTLCTAMLRRGFRYVVRRPVHPAALRLLLMQVLYAGEDQRVVARFPFGAQVRWRSGLTRGHCTMTEISAHGCRLLTSERFAFDSRLHLRVPATLAGSKDLRLRGRVMRRDVHSDATGTRTEVAVQFERLSARTLAHLDALLAERASGPATTRDGVPAAPSRRRTQRGSSRFRSLTAPRDPAPTAPRESPPLGGIERRRHRRGAWHSEVLALDEQTQQVMHVLLGTDLSTGGLRVEPHPLLRIGDRLTLALYDAGRTEPLLLAARVAHEDGRRGWGLIFEDSSPELVEQLQAMVAELPPVSALSKDDDKPEGVVLGEIVALAKPDPD